MTLKTLPLKLGIIAIPIFINWVYTIILHSGPIDNLYAVLFDLNLIPITTLVINSHIIVLGLAVYLSVKLWIKYVHKTKND